METGNLGCRPLTSKRIPRNMLCMNRFIVALIAAAITFCCMAVAADSAKSSTSVQRPPIVGVAWIGLRTADMEATRKFYTGYLGLEEQSEVKDPANGGRTRTVFKVN